ncbi:MAG TPA: periplasmic heavy metal sensor [Gemmatimonadales bacterium]|jgi:Spy/CpxP family protein refolding chaperone|nr:periplasmic heavy metal sensor [Gemmatimonadales bacterium]
MFNRSRTWAVVLLAATFGAGIAAGWAMQAWADDRGGTRGRRGPDAMVAYLAGELDLTAAQRDSVRAVFARHRPEMRALWESVHPQMDSLRRKMRDEIASHLTSTQQARYRDLVAGWGQRHRSDSSTETTGDAR